MKKGCAATHPFSFVKIFKQNNTNSNILTINSTNIGMSFDTYILLS